jgi:hypothetical protein
MTIKKHPTKVVRERVVEAIDFLNQLTLELSIYKLNADELLDLLEKLKPLVRFS